MSLAACQSAKAPKKPILEAELKPSSWSEADGTVLSSNWVAELGSPTLVGLVAESEKNNFGLEAAQQNVRAAQAVARISKSLRGPSLSASLGSGRSRSRLPLEPPVIIERDTHSLTLGARWEVDIWNRLGLQSAASEAQYLATQYDFEALRLSLASQVAKSWFSAIAAKAQQDLAEASAQTFDSQSASLESRYSRGVANALDLRLVRGQASTSRAVAIRRRSELDTATRNLETLMGRYPSAALLASESLPELGSKPAAGIPSELLARRPDLKAQENRLAAALALEAASSRNWLPSVVLTASDGTVSSRFSELLDSNFNVWSLAADASMALFQSGRLAAEREQLNASQLTQLARYKDLALQAFREVETALRAEADFLELEAQTRISADENQDAEDQAWQRYQRGLVDITSVLDAQRRAFEAKSQLISIRNQRLQNRINLHLALAGDL